MSADSSLMVLALRAARHGIFDIAESLGTKSEAPTFVAAVIAHLRGGGAKMASMYVGDGKSLLPHGAPPPSPGDLGPVRDYVDREALRPLIQKAFEAGREHERKQFSAAATGQLGRVEWIPPADLVVDPARFQFRHGHDAADGTVHDLPEERFDAEECEPLVGWHDPADGRDYVVDGHHRLAWAERDGAKRIPVRFLTAATAEGAKEYGARLNREQAPRTFATPGPPPRPGLQWRDATHRWVRPDTGEEVEHAPGGSAVSQVHYHGEHAPAAGWQHVATSPEGQKVWAAPAKQPGMLGRLLGRKKPPQTLDPVQAGHTDTHTLQSRMDASPQYQAAKRQVDARSAGGFQQLAQQAGKSVDEVKKELVAKAQTLVDSQDVYVRASAKTLPLVIQGGRFKTVHETGASAALSNPKLRREIEAKGMGIDPSEPAQIRPLSAYLGGKDFSTVGQEKGVASYGELVVKLKDHVKDRTTVTFGDSLEQIQNGYAVASPMKAIRPESINPREVLHDPRFFDSHADVHRSKGFVEACVHGGVAVHEIEEIGFPTEPPAETQKALHAHGIKWRVYGTKTHAATFSAFSDLGESEEPALFTLDEVNTFAAKPDGSTWKTNGRWYKREGGKTVRIPDPNAQDKGASESQPAAPNAAEPATTKSKGATPSEIHARVAAAHQEYTAARHAALAGRGALIDLEESRGTLAQSGKLDEAAALDGQIAAALEKQKALNRKRGEAADAVRSTFMAMMASSVKNPAKFTRSTAPVNRSDAHELAKPTPGQERVFTDAHAFVAAVCHWPSDAPPAYRTGVAQDGRAFYANDTWGIAHKEPIVAVGRDFGYVADSEKAGRSWGVEMNQEQATRVHVHELGHLIEYRKPGVQEKARKFVEARCAGEAPTNLRQQFGTQYDAHEEGRKDDFSKVFGDSLSAYYTGKVYPSGATEIVSMGLQKLHEDPGGFAEADPEYFQFMVEVLTM